METSGWSRTLLSLTIIIVKQEKEVDKAGRNKIQKKKGKRKMVRV